VLRLENLRYDLPGGRRLFDGVSLQLEPYDAVAVTGPSGSGKSTLLALAGELLKPTAGQVVCSGPPNRSVAWVLQSLNAFTNRTAKANATLIARLDSDDRPAMRRRYAEVFERLGLTQFGSAEARTMSGGELQRLTVARALISRRPLILADEPTNQLDRENAQVVMEALFAAAADEGRIVLVVTHDENSLPDGSRLCRLTQTGLSGT
jgi:ABC-type lipoprotein export system ATPase subunit